MIEVTVTVKSIDGNNVDTTMAKTVEYSPGNPVYYADAIRQLGERLTNELADRYADLYPTDAPAKAIV